MQTSLLISILLGAAEAAAPCEILGTDPHETCPGATPRETEFCSSLVEYVSVTGGDGTFAGEKFAEF